MIRSLSSPRVALCMLRRAASTLSVGHPSAVVTSASSTPRSHQQQPHSLRFPSVAAAPRAGGPQLGNRKALRSAPSLSLNFRSLHVLGVRCAGAGGKFAWGRAGEGRGGRGGSGASMFSGRPDGYQHFKSDKSDRESSAQRIGLNVFLIVLPGSMVCYYLFHLDKVPYTDRLRMIDMPRDSEIAMGRAHYFRLLKGANVLPPNHPASLLVSQVGQRIAKATGEDLPWEFRVVDSPQVNAFCLPGGKVVVYTGLLAFFDPQERENALAVVLAHECAHAVARHSAEQMGFVKIMLFADWMLRFLFQTPHITNYIATLAFQLPYNRNLELEADYIGLQLLARTCHYPPAAAPRVFSKLAELQARSGSSQGAVSSYFSTHPTSEKRSEKLGLAVPVAEEARKKHCSSSLGEFQEAAKRPPSIWELGY